MKTLILAVVLIFAGLGAASGQSLASWQGTYEGAGSGINATGSRSFSSWAKLEISCGSQACEATYSDGENSDTYNRFLLKAKGGPNSLSFYYAGCLPAQEGSSEACSSPYEEGGLLFKLEKRKAAKGKARLLTIWGKLRKEGAGNTYFKKS